MKTIMDIPDLRDKKILLRVDFDVPLRQSSGQAVEIEEDFRIKKQKEMIDWLIERGAKVVMVAHISAPTLRGRGPDRSVRAVGSFSDLMPQLHILLGQEVGFIKNVEDIEGYLANYPGVGLLDNIRNPAVAGSGEENNSKEFAQNLSKGFDLYINNAFAVCHRNHASVAAITGFLPSYAGMLVKEEVVQLSKAITAPKEGKVVIVGGAKAKTKIPVIKNFLNKADMVLLGGVVANDVLKEKGQDMGSSVVDDNYKELLAGLDINDPKLMTPEDFVVFDNKILDIGEKTIQKYANTVGGASMVIWNGPMGLFENSAFVMGTNALAKVIANSSAYKILGGGDTISAVNKIGLLDKFDFVSTGGGAMLAFLAGEKLPGLEVLGYYKN